MSITHQFRTLTLLATLVTSLACAPSSPDTAPKQTDTEPTPPIGPLSAPVPVVDSGIAKLVSVYFGDLPQPLLQTAPQSPERKNASIILIVMDATNVKHLSAYGYERNTTPTIDRLAKRGILFTNHVSNSSWTRPSYTSIITGLPKRVHKVELNTRDLERKITTLAERFKAAGYRTVGFTGNPLVQEIFGYSQGYERYEDTRSFEKRFPPDEWLADKALRWMEKVKDKPFFATFFFTAPHVPYRPEAGHTGFMDALSTGTVVEHPFREYVKPLPRADQEKTLAAYDDEIRYTDLQIQKIVEKLEALGISDNTAIMITADHGEAFGEHGCYQHTYHMWEPVLRVPLVVSAPWHADVHGTRSALPLTHVDIAPTALHLAGLPREDPSLHGTSILSLLEKRTEETETRRIYSQYDAHGIKRQSVRKGRYKLIHHNHVKKSALRNLNRLNKTVPRADTANLPSLALDGERFELYDLLSDPGENNNLFEAQKNAPHTIALLNALTAKDKEGSSAITLSDETLQALRAAGYIR